MIDKIIKKYSLHPHPEGGFFSETYRSEGIIDQQCLPSNIESERVYSTAIYFLLTRGNISHFHKIKSDEMWHFYLGDPLKIYEITEDGKLLETILGDLDSSGIFQYVVKANRWFASESCGEFSFVGCTVSPGFDFKDFELASYDKLKSSFSHLDIDRKYFIK